MNLTVNTEYCPTSQKKLQLFTMHAYGQHKNKLPQRTADYPKNRNFLLCITTDKLQHKKVSPQRTADYQEKRQLFTTENTKKKYHRGLNGYQKLRIHHVILRFPQLLTLALL